MQFSISFSNFIASQPSQPPIYVIYVIFIGNREILLSLPKTLPYPNDPMATCFVISFVCS
ncbi:hypothetical protein I79_018740 [Cricetulus griseus]|uniref:Uncharacterized protein n=1 Tax=Cricetulus griseus TaxID=10029 RepID=G3I5J1_CRIGR|nr:hypothetical protein I79_018740 [Cricetulus griseus]